ncbi:hypothetical protein PAHAL_5G216500 [Panicum hallii]|uniref:Uncharacterized protein n=1 Tax=Panicum hallii TaxID=206008 RepID=A0A2T8IKS2_9POAL|nr:hypothetical protein PAHAL_5G216500 [Panicum hallii]
MLATGTTVRRSLLVPLFALQAPSSTVSLIKGDYGRWIAFVGILLRLFYSIPGELELPLSTVLLVMTAPYQFMDSRYESSCLLVILVLCLYMSVSCRLFFTG